jgi:hypothetical protein
MRRRSSGGDGTAGVSRNGVSRSVGEVPYRHVNSKVGQSKRPLLEEAVAARGDTE